MVWAFGDLVLRSARRRRLCVLSSLVAALLAATRLAAQDSAAEHGARSTTIAHKVEGPSELQNLMQLSPRLYSGGEPHAADAFAELARRGIKTIVSVDGARPDVAEAKRHGLRYIHIPIGYDGVDKHAQLSLVRLMREADEPIYVHCHHGKHRGPAAAAVACLAAGEMSREQAIDYLVHAGTGKQYAGLWRDVSGFTPPAANEPLPELVETAKVATLAAAMADLDRAWDRLKLCADADWQTPPDHADLTPAHEALLVYEALRESRRTLTGPRAALAADLKRAEKIAARLRDSLETGDSAAASQQLTALEQSCTQCHAEHRN
ncbi:MAG: cytochrome c [Planctomycetales bacterium]|nr:cytochrome c [Planctomycetales bacterium]